MAKTDRGNTDPTVRSDTAASAWPEGTHPARPAAEVTHSASRIKYRDNPDKPDPSTVAQLAEIPEDFPAQ
jgi:hypothetical protein